MSTLAELRAEIRAHYLPDEERALAALVAAADLDPAAREKISARAAGLVRGNRWSTDAAGGRRFVNVYTGADRVEDERFSGNFVGRGMA